MAEPSGTEDISVTERFSDNGDGTVTDNVTGLQWERSEGGDRDYRDAEEYVRKLNLGGHLDWRLPDLEELIDLAGIGHRQLQKVFPNLRAKGYWAKPRVDDHLYILGSTAYAVDFDPSSSRDYGKATALLHRTSGVYVFLRSRRKKGEVYRKRC